MNKAEETRIVELLNELSGLLPGFDPLEVSKNDAEQKMGLATAFANKGFRDYLRKAIRSQVASSQDVTTMEGLWSQKSRVLVLKELYRASEQCFNEAEKLSKVIK